jgi:predicted dehydrogenase
LKQLSQELRSGQVELAEVPDPRPGPGQVLVRSRVTLVSAGSERTLVEFGQASLLAKARSEPERVRQVLDKIRADGLLPTLEVVFARLDQAMPLGYCNAGVVVEVGPGVRGLKAGDRVASNGPHAELALVPENLCARIPDGVSDETAAFTVLGAVALEGLRLVQPTLGESMGVVGLGLVGLLAVQLLKANGCRVIGFDPDPDRRALAERFGASTAGADPDAMVEAGMAFSRGRGLDGVLVAAAAPQADLIRPSARMSRKRGRIVLTGVVDLQIDRREFYDRELSFQVSCSYGPGRYEADYEEKGIDYPLPYVRWTEGRNFEAFLDLAAAGTIGVEPLVGRRVPFAESPAVYRTLAGDRPRGAPALLLTYPADPAARTTVVTLPAPGIAARPGTGRVRVGVIGSGQFARLVMLPALCAAGADLVAIASRRGLQARDLGRKFAFRRAVSESAAILDDPEIDAVAILTRHDSHAALARRALERGKHVFVEKPLAIRPSELPDLEAARRDHPAQLLTVGFNRGFAPLVDAMRAPLRTRVGPAVMVTTINAGALPGDHWLLDPEVGGGRLIGEACHWIELMVSLARGPVRSVSAVPTGPSDRASGDPSVTLTLEFADGSTGTLHYLTRGHRAFPKERVEVFFDGKVLVLDNFRSLTTYEGRRVRRTRLWRQDKGHRAEVAAFVSAVARGGPEPIPFARLAHVTRVSFAAVEALVAGRAIPLEDPAATAKAPA